jgi:hypothetical protein
VDPQLCTRPQRGRRRGAIKRLQKLRGPALAAAAAAGDAGRALCGQAFSVRLRSTGGRGPADCKICEHIHLA